MLATRDSAEHFEGHLEWAALVGEGLVQSRPLLCMAETIPLLGGGPQFPSNRLAKDFFLAVLLVQG